MADEQIRDLNLSETHTLLLINLYLSHVQGPSYVPHGVESAYIHINRDIEEDDDAYSEDGFCAVPASSDAIAALPETTVSETETREEEACAVCLEGFKEGDKVKKMPCSHDFHSSCISDSEMLLSEGSLRAIGSLPLPLPLPLGFLFWHHITFLF